MLILTGTGLPFRVVAAARKLALRLYIMLAIRSIMPSLFAVVRLSGCPR
jgi:hypothetical protein